MPRSAADRAMKLLAATVLRAVTPLAAARGGLRFWHDHFQCRCGGQRAHRVALPAYDRDVIRRHCSEIS